MENNQWTYCLQILKQSISRDNYQTWAEVLRFHSFDSATLILEVPSSTFVDVMWPEIGDLLLQAIHTAFGENAILKFTITPDTSSSRSGQVSVPRLGAGGNGYQTESSTDTSSYFDTLNKNGKNGRSGRGRGACDTNGTNTNPNGAPNAEQPKEAQKSPINSYLIPHFTFENFVEGRSNKTARTIAESIANNPHQNTFNPFFLYGPSGVGKTHLVNAIGLRIKRLFPNLRVLFVSANLFKTQFTDSYLNNTTNDFIHFYQTIDVLIIDDFQEITTAATQRAFFHIFNHLQQNNHKIIITCDRPPSEFEGIEERMLTRLKWGVVTEIERPDITLRKAILKSKMKRNGIEMPSNVIQYIADNVSDNVRELEGTINSLMAFSLFDNCDIDLELARRVVARLVNQARKEMTLDVIMTAVCEKYKAKSRDLTGKSRKKELVVLRQLVMYLAHKYSKLSISQIGREMGGRDHSTVLHSCNQAQHRLATDKAYRLEIEKLEASLKKG